MLIVPQINLKVTCSTMEEAVKDRENLYKMIISQLRYDGCEAIAANLAKTTNIISPCPPSARLHQVVNLGLRAEAEGNRPENQQLPGLTNNLGSSVTTKGIDLEYEPEEYNGHHRDGQSDTKGYMVNIDLKKASCSSDSGGDSDRENIPPREVQEHILKITKAKIAAEEINVVRSNGEHSAPSDDLNTDNVCSRVKRELQKMNISQEVFAKCVLGKTQGYLSEMLKHGEKVFYTPEKANSKGRMNFEKMRQFLGTPEEERRAIYAAKARQLREERFSRKRMSLTMAYKAEDMNEYSQSPTKVRKFATNYDSSISHLSQMPSPDQAQGGSPSRLQPKESSPYLYKKERSEPQRENSVYLESGLPQSQHVAHHVMKGSTEAYPRVLYMTKAEPTRILEVPPYVVCKKEAMPEPSRPQKEPETNLVASKIAALSRKQPTPLKTRPTSQDHGTTPPAAMYETYYVTAHKAPCRTAAFSASGRLVATGSVDASIKVLDVDRMVAKNTMPQAHDQGQGMNLENHPVIRTLYDHTEEVTALDFHPFASVLVSGGKDCTIKLFDISKPSVKKAYRAIQEAEVINSMSFHPSGDFILVSTEHPTIRLYDTNTFQCFAPANPREYHTGPVTMVKYAPMGNLYASSSTDGSIKVWDGVSNRCVSTFTQAHKGAEVYTIQFSQNSKYLISSGKDSVVFLWELSTGRAVNMYTGAAMTNYRTQATFNHTEDFILVADEKNNSISCWDTRTTEKQKSLPSGHNNHIRCLVHSPAGAAFVSCSDDFRARFWYCEGI